MARHLNRFHKTEYEEITTARKERNLLQSSHMSPKPTGNSLTNEADDLNKKSAKKVSTVWTNFKLVFGGEKVICLHCAEETLLLVSKTVP